MDASVVLPVASVEASLPRSFEEFLELCKGRDQQCVRRSFFTLAGIQSLRDLPVSSYALDSVKTDISASSSHAEFLMALFLWMLGCALRGNGKLSDSGANFIFKDGMQNAVWKFFGEDECLKVVVAEGERCPEIYMLLTVADVDGGIPVTINV